MKKDIYVYIIYIYLSLISLSLSVYVHIHMYVFIHKIGSLVTGVILTWVRPSLTGFFKSCIFSGCYRFRRFGTEN